VRPPRKPEDMTRKARPHVAQAGIRACECVVAALPPSHAITHSGYGNAISFTVAGAALA